MTSGFLPPSLTSLFERNQEATCYVGNLDLRVNEEILWELFIQCGPVVNVHIPRDKITGEHQGFGFVEFRNEEDADYAIKIMHMIKLYGKPIKVNKASQDKRTQEVGANIFVGNLHDDVDEKMLKDVFSAFGVVLSTKIMRNPESGSSKRYGFVSFDNFDSSDAAINTMNGQFISGKVVDVSYAYKKDTKGERHGSIAERILAANRPNSIYSPMFPMFGGVNDMSMSMVNNYQNFNNMKPNSQNNLMNIGQNKMMGNMPNFTSPFQNNSFVRPPNMPPPKDIPIFKPTDK
jgi:splicing factor 3B subunit 4